VVDYLPQAGDGVTVRIIPRLDIKGENLVKGIHLEGLRVLGKPERFARDYYEQGADELLYIDIVASLYGRNSLAHIVERTSREIFIPLTVGGGLRTIDDIRAILRAGADKVALNTAAVQRPELVAEAARRFGSSTIVVSIEAIRRRDGSWEAYTDNGRCPTGLDACEWAVRAAELGAGEILLTSIDREGTGEGFDLELTRRVAASVPIPVIACGGAGTAGHVRDVIEDGDADAVAVASILHYAVIRADAYREDVFTEGNIEFLRSGQGFSRVTPTDLWSLKKALTAHGVPARMVSGGLRG
jgi:cyclase